MTPEPSAAKPRYAPSTTKAEWIAYSESLEREIEKLTAVADAARLWVATEDSILYSPGISGTEAWNRTRRAHRDTAAALAALEPES